MTAVLARRVEGSAVGAPAETAPAAAAAPARVGLGTVLGALAGLAGLLVGLAPVHDNSFLTHLATGRLILDTGGIPRVDPYSFTAAGDPWVVQSWLASTIYAAVEQVGGFGGIRLLNGLLCAALGVVTWLLTARSRSVLVRLAATGLVLAAAPDLWSGRPLLFGLLGLGAVLLAADGRLDPRWLVPIGWVWVNTHGSFPLGVAVLVALAVGARLDDGAWGPERRVLGWALAGLALGAVNPLGPRLLVFPALVGQRSEAFSAVAEWQPPEYENLAQLLVLAAVLLGALALVRRPAWRSALPFVGFGALALTAARNGAPFLLVAAPVLAGALPDLGPSVAGFRRSILRPAAAAVAVLGVVLAGVALRDPDVGLGAYPVDAVAWMEDAGLWGEEARVVAPDYVGNYREAQRGAEARVFIDDRVDMYPIAVIRDYRLLRSVGPGWQDVLAERGITAVLWPADSPLGAALAGDGAWRVAHRDATWLVVVPA